jgi:hypothetical protein
MAILSVRTLCSLSWLIVTVIASRNSGLVSQHMSFVWSLGLQGESCLQGTGDEKLLQTGIDVACDAMGLSYRLNSPLSSLSYR